MALHVLPILKALAPILVSAGSIAAGFRSPNVHEKAEDRLRKLEDEALLVGRLLTGVTEQLQAVAEELRSQGEVAEAHARKIKTMFTLSLIGMGVSLVCLGLVAFT